MQGLGWQGVLRTVKLKLQTGIVVVSVHRSSTSETTTKREGEEDADDVEDV